MWQSATLTDIWLLRFLLKERPSPFKQGDRLTKPRKFDGKSDTSGASSYDTNISPPFSSWNFPQKVSNHGIIPGVA
jgi:hypothetical protein